jgi:hypothetical protein
VLVKNKMIAILQSSLFRCVVSPAVVARENVALGISG